MGRRMHYFMEWDNVEMPIATRDKYGVEIDVTKRMKDDGNEEEAADKIAPLFGDSLFHSSGLVENDGLEEADTYVGLGDDRAREVDEELAMQVEEATKNGLSK